MLNVHHQNNHKSCPPLLSVYGGKITTFRHLGQAACHKLQKYLPHMGVDWTETAQLPGGDINKNNNIAEFINQLENAHDWLPKTLIRRLATHYGSNVRQIIKDATNLDDLGENLGADIYTAELDYVIENEWVLCADDYLWRRTRMGLHIDDEIKAKIESYIQNQVA
ncbi:MAG: hypothetical protein HRU28_17500 [Rhizobiales bacterium]|nr:hypothetical protein [Hyphomicrobiales bacterium]